MCLAILSLMIAVLLLVHLVGTISANTEDKAIQFDAVVELMTLFGV